MKTAPEPRLPEPWLTLAVRVNGGVKYGCVTRLAASLGALQCTLRKWAHGKITPHRSMQESIHALFDAHGVGRPIYGSTHLTNEALRLKRKNSREAYALCVRLGLCPKCSTPTDDGVYCKICSAKDLARKGVLVSRDAAMGRVKAGLRAGVPISLSGLARIIYPDRVFKNPQGAALAASLHCRYLMDCGVIHKSSRGDLFLSQSTI